jgi:3-methylcrotonyl-CoA carboxylase alpha subunit
MNTRLQVEHPVTEALTGLDLVEWQFRVAAGEQLPLKQPPARFDGHAIEARLYAEDPENGFLPSTGRIVALELPDDIRVDRGVETDGEVTPYYDPMIAKLIAHAATRDAALERLASALDRTLLAGPRSNVGFLTTLCRAGEFRQGRVDTGFIDRNLTALGAVPHAIDRAAAALGVASLLAGTAGEGPAAETSLADETAEVHSPWTAKDGFQLGGVRSVIVPVAIDGDSANATVCFGADGMSVTLGDTVPATDARVFEADAEAYVVRRGRQTRVRIEDFARVSARGGTGNGLIKAPMHGRVLEVLAGVGEQVTAGQRLAVIEAMKMEHTLRAPFAGTVSKVPVTAGAQVVEGAEIMVIEPAKAE